MKALSLFSGIGGLDLAAHAVGIETVVFSEIEPYAVKILEKRWPDVENVGDITRFTNRTLRELGGSPFHRFKCPADYKGTIDVVHGGFPCQDLSVAGKQKGLEGERSGLWYEMLRVIAECRPRFVLAENVRGAVNLALDTVYSGLVNEGYKVYPYVIPASAVGAPHQRERLFVIVVREDVADGLRSRSTVGFPRPFQGEEGEPAIPLDDGAPSGNLWPTPTVGTSGGGKLCGGTGHLNMLRDALGYEEARKLSAGNGGQLSADWVSLLMGFPTWWTNPERGMLYATTIKTITGEILYVVREENGEEVIRRQVRGYECFSEEEVLLSSMRWEGKHEEASNQVGNREKTNTPQRRKMQRMWQNLRIGNSPHRRRQIQQHHGELDDVVRYLSHEVALGEWKNHAEETVGLQNLWCSCQEVGYVPETLSALQEVWRSLSYQEKNLVIVCAMGRAPFPACMNATQYPYEPPRTCTKLPNRAARLKCLGNAVVPQQAFAFFLAIAEMEGL